jgi:uncharacterized protein (DUF302 family)
MGVEGVVSIDCAAGPGEVLARMKHEIASHGLELFAEIDHAKNAAEVWRRLAPNTLLVFGNAKAGTALMQARQSVGLDLPLRALIWVDSGYKTWISYSDPVWIAERHSLSAEAAAKMSEGLAAIAKVAAAA